MGGIAFVTRDGCRFTPRMSFDFERLAAALRAAFPGVELHASSALRTYEEQEAIFRDRYVVQASGNGPYGDVRWWNGARWVRVKSGGTVAQPGSSNHEFESTGYGAVDVYDSASDAGVTVAGTVRAKWLRAHAAEFGFEPEGYGFAEPWHLKYVGDLWGSLPGGGDDMSLIFLQGVQGKRRGGLYWVAGGAATFLGYDPKAKDVPFIADEGVIAELQKYVSGLS